MVSCAALVLKSWQRQGRCPHLGKCMSLPFVLPCKANAKEACTKQEAGNCTAPSGSKLYSLLAGWRSHLVSGEVTWWRTVRRNPAPAMMQDCKCLLAFNDPDTASRWLARDLPYRLQNWVKSNSSLVLNKDVCSRQLALLEQTVNKRN